MKKFFIFLVLFLLVGSAAFAGGANQNQSADWVTQLSRGASTTTDSAYFNPAGTALMNEGLYLYFDYQCIIQPVTIESTSALPSADGDFEGSKSAYYFGNLYLSYVKDNLGPGSLGFSFVFVPVGGGGGGSFPDGLPALAESYSSASGAADMSVEASSAMYGLQVNFSYAILNKMLSFALGYRFIYHDASYETDITTVTGSLNDKVEILNSGIGHSIIAGVSGQPLKSESMGTLTIGLKYEWHSVLRGETEVDIKENDSTNAATVISNFGYVDGQDTVETLPMSLSFGIGYANWGVNMSLSFNYYLESVTYYGRGLDGEDLDQENDWELAIGGMYTLPMLPLHISLGYQYSKVNDDDGNRNELNEGLSSHSVGFGIGYTFIEKIRLVVGYNFAYYMPVDVNKGLPLGESNYNKTSHDVTLGLEYKIL